MEFTRLALTIAAPALLAPIAVFCVNAQASGTIKTLRLLIPLGMVALGLALINFSYCRNNLSLDCAAYKSIDVIVGTLAYTMYLGWFEYIWRRKHKQIVWPLSENIQYGASSNLILAISLILTIAFIIICSIAEIRSFIL